MYECIRYVCEVCTITFIWYHFYALWCIYIFIYVLWEPTVNRVPSLCRILRAVCAIHHGSVCVCVCCPSVLHMCGATCNYVIVHANYCSRHFLCEHTQEHTHGSHNFLLPVLPIGCTIVHQVCTCCSSLATGGVMADTLIVFGNTALPNTRTCRTTWSIDIVLYVHTTHS